MDIAGPEITEKKQILDEINVSDRVNEEQIYNKEKRTVVHKYNGIR